MSPRDSSVISTSGDHHLSPVMLCMSWIGSRERAAHHHKTEDRGTRVGGEALCKCWLKGTLGSIYIR